MRTFLLSLFILFSAFGPVIAGNDDHLHNAHESPFIENKGQWEHDLIFRSEFSGGRFSIYKNKFRFGFLNHDDLENFSTLYHDKSETGKAQLQQHIIHGHIYDMEFVNANADPEIIGFEKQSLYHNYFLGSDQSKWAGNVPLFGGVLYKELWDGIGLSLRETGNAFEYDFIVKPGADIQLIQLAFNGQSNIELKDGKLLITTSVNTVFENAPYVYQNINGKKIEIECHYKLENGIVSFELPESYDSAYELIIDPVLVFATYSGSTASNYGFTATFDEGGNYYGAGIVFGPGYPVTAGAFQTTFAGGSTDVGITKYNPDGTAQVYATYIGGSGSDNPHSMIVDKQNRLIVYGSTSSSDFPVTADAYDQSHNGGQYDIFISKFNSQGSDIVGSTFIGGSGDDGRNDSWDLSPNYGDAARGEVMIDEVNRVYIASSTNSSNFPTTGGSAQQTSTGGQDACAFKMASDLSGLLWSTFLGGSSDDAGYSIKITEDDEAIICGGTSSSNFPTTAGVINPSYQGNVDGFIVNLNNAVGSLNHASYLGTVFYDQAYFVEIDIDGDIFTVGQTKGLYPVTPGVWAVSNSAQFIHKMPPDFSSTILSTVFGDGSRSTIDLSLTAFLVDDCSNIYVSGWGGGLNFEGSVNNLPITTDAIQPTTDGKDFYFIVIQKNFSDLLYGTYYGGDVGMGEHVDGGTSRFDKKGVIYQGICACGSQSLPTTPGAWSSVNGSGCNLGSVKMDVGFAGVYAGGEAEPNAFGCAPFIVNFNSFSNGVDFMWDFGDGSLIDTTENPSHIYDGAGVYDVMFIAIDSNLCIIADTAYLQITVVEPGPISASYDFETDCNDLSVSVINTGTIDTGVVYNWDMGDGTIYTEDTVLHIYSSPGTYDIILTVTDTLCAIDSTAANQITILPSIGSNFALLDADFNFLFDWSGCSPFEVNFQNNSGNGDYIWDFGDGSPTQTDFEPNHIYADSGTFEVSLIALDSLSCNIADTMLAIIEVYESTFLLADFSYDGSCTDSLFVFTNTGTTGLPNDSYKWDFGDGNSAAHENPIHTYNTAGTYKVTLIVSDTGFCTMPDTTAIFVQVGNPNVLLADFDFTANCNDSLVIFNNTGSIGLPAGSYYWDFGDGDTSNLENPAHNYSIDGTYIVSLIVGDTGLCTIPDTIIVPVEVTFDLDLLADFDIVGSCEDTSITAVNTGTTNDSNVEYLWDMGDSTFYSGESVSHGYDQPGVYSITLRLTGLFCGNIAVNWQQVELAPTIVADFTVDPGLEGCVPFDVQFLNNSITGSSTSFIWNFGNNTGSGEEDPSTMYDQPSTYDVTLITTDPESCNLVDTQMVEIIVNPGVLVEFMQEESLCDGEFLTLDAGNPGSTYIWSTGENTQIIQVDEQGEYSVVVSNEFCDDSDTTYLTVYDHPNYNSSTDLCPDQQLMLSALENGSDYLWSTGETTIDIVVSDEGLYWNKYLDENSCERSDTTLVTLIDETEQVFAPNSFTPNGDGTNDAWKVYGAGFENEFEIQIFNRWGNLIWESKDINASWNGFYKGAKSEPGVYAYKLYFYSECYGKRIETIGSILLIN